MRALVLVVMLTFTIRPSAAQAGKRAPAKCLENLGTKSYFGSAEQVRELQRRFRAWDVKTCPRVGFRFASGPRRVRVLYDRLTGAIVRVGIWQGEAGESWEYWSGVSDASVLADPADGAIDAGQYHNGPNTRSLPESTRRAVAKLAP